MAYSSDLANVQFENENELRKYPFSDGSSLADMFGREVPLDLVSDVHFSVGVGADDVSFLPEEAGGMFKELALPTVKLASAHLSPYMVSVCFRSKMGGRTDALSVTVKAEDFTPYFPYRMEPLLWSSGIGGFVSFGNLKFPDFPETYFLDNAEVHPCCVSAVRRNSLTAFVDPRSGEKVSGDVEIAFSEHIAAKRDGSAYSLSLEEGSGDALMSECLKSGGMDSCGATPITSINGVRPDPDGNIVIWFH